MKKLMVFFIIAFLFMAILTGLVIYANNVFLPKILKAKLTTAISEFSSSKVTLGSLRLNLLKGLVLQDLAIYDKDTAEKELAHIDELSASVMVLPIFKEKKVIIPSLSLKGAQLSLVRRKDNSLNIQYLLDKAMQKTGQGPLVLVRSLAISEGTVKFEDEAFSPTRSAALGIKHAKVDIGLRRITFSYSGTIERATKPANLSLEGNYAFSTQNLSSRVTVKELDIKDYSDYLKDFPLVLGQGMLEEFQADFTLEGNKKIAGGLRFSSKDLAMTWQDYELSQADLKIRLSFMGQTDNWSSLKGQGIVSLTTGLLKAKNYLKEGHINQSQAEIKANNGIFDILPEISASEISIQKEKSHAVLGKLGLRGQVSIPLKDPAAGIAYKGKLDMSSISFYDIDYIDTAQITEASLSFNEKTAELEKCIGKVLGAEVTAKGSYKDGSLTLHAASQIPVSNALRVIKEHFWPALEQASGEAKIDVTLRSDLKTSNSISGSLDLNKPALTIKGSSQEWKAGSSRAVFDSGKQTLKLDVKGLDYAKRAFDIEANLQNYVSPLVDLKAASPGTNLTVKAKKTGNIIDITSLAFKTNNSILQAKGKLDTDSKNLQIETDADLNFEDLKEWLPSKQLFEEPLNLKGACQIKAQGSGPLTDWKAWKLQAKANSKQVRLKSFSIQNINFDYNQISGQGFVNLFSFEAYSGQGQLKGRIDLNNRQFVYQLSGQADSIDLGLLKNDIPEMKEKPFYGILGLQIIANGTGFDPKQIKGQAQLFIKEGNIWEFNPLKGLGDFIFIPGFNAVVFSKASGDFYIDDGYIITDNLELEGPDLGLLVQGKMGMDGSLDFIAMTQVPKSRPEALQQAGGVTAIAITGNIQNPLYKLRPVTRNIMKKLGELLSNITP